MVRLQVDKKVVGGKYAKVELEVEDDTIVDVIISGDFFAFPIEEFERFLEDLKGKKFDVEQVERTFREHGNKIVFSGISLEDLRELFLQLINKRGLNQQR